MTFIRQRLGLAALALLLLQVCAAAVLPIRACCEERRATVVMDCCREGRAGHICPMKPKNGEPECRLRAACDTDTAALTAAAYWIGVVPERFELEELSAALTLRAVPPPPAFSWLQPPPTPPPIG